MGDFRELCAELVEYLALLDEPPHEMVCRARAALSAAPPEPVGEGEVLTDGPAVPEGREPASVTGKSTDEELLELMPETMRDEFSYAAKACSNATGGQVKPGIFRVCLNSAALEYARAVLARYSHQPAPVAESEVKDRVAWLRRFAAVDWIADETADKLYATAKLLEQCYCPASVPVGEVGDEARYLTRELRDQADDMSPALELFGLMHRAADLLQQRHPAPVPVSERLPGPEDCDAEGRCWLLTVEDEYPQWRLHSVEGHQPGGRMIWVPVDRTPGVMVDAFYASHWLPAHAIPLPAPQGEEVG